MRTDLRRRRPAGAISMMATLITAALVAVLALIVFLVPVPTPFSGSFATSSLGGAGGTLNASYADGASVSGTWSASGTQPVGLVISSGSGDHVFTGDGATGSFSFISHGGSYVYSATSFVPENVSLQGTARETTAQYVANAV